MNLPNVITLLRIALVPVFLVFLIQNRYGLAAGVFIIAGLTDAIDGAVARMTNKKTELGALLDPLADKFLVLTAFVALALMGRLPLWLAGAVIIRDAAIIAGCFYFYRRGFRDAIRPTPLGKLTTFMLIFLLMVALAGLYMGREFALTEYLSRLAAALLAASGAQYIIRGFRIIYGKKNNLAG